MLQHVLATHSFLKNLFIFNWRVIASQCCVGFCQTLNESAIGIHMFRASLVAQMVKNLPVMQETWVWSLGWEDPLEEGMAIHSSILAWRIPWTEEPGGLQSMGSQRVGHDWVTKHSTACICSLPLEPPSPPPPGYYRVRSEFCEPHSKFLLAIYLTYSNVCFHLTLYIHPTLSFISPDRVHKSVLYVWVSIAPFIFIYFAAQDLQSLWHSGSFVVTYGLFNCSMWNLVSQPGKSLHWEPRVLVTGPAGKSCNSPFFNWWVIHWFLEIIWAGSHITYALYFRLVKKVFTKYLL